MGCPDASVRFTMDLDGFGYATQLIQAECLDQAYRMWMRNFKGRGREYTAGAVVWQLNDCWPCISWSIADYFLRRKPACELIDRHDVRRHLLTCVSKSLYHEASTCATVRVRETDGGQAIP